MMPNLSELPLNEQQLIDKAKTIAGDFIQNKAIVLFNEHADMLTSLTPLQKEYVYYVGMLKAQEIKDLTFEETLALGEILVKCSELNLKQSEELNKFWSKFSSYVKDIIKEVGEIGVGIASKALLSYFPI